MDRSGFRYLIVFGLIALAGIISQNLYGYIIAGISGLFLLFTAFFFRDPERKIPDGNDIIVSPADGVIVDISDVRDDDIGDCKNVAIFMSLANVHINRAPLDGDVIEVKHFDGKFKKAFLSEASLENERVEMLIETEFGKIRVKQIAGIIARRIICRAKVGDSLHKGQKYGIIHFGSRVELILSQSANIFVSNGQKVVAGETIVAKIK
ncbi:phosphatidylserine decarboxylase family protein [bacterium]|nr:phosphatidylserine decarboxylase family protein [bacterium]